MFEEGRKQIKGKRVKGDKTCRTANSERGEALSGTDLIYERDSVEPQIVPGPQRRLFCSVNENAAEPPSLKPPIGIPTQSAEDGVIKRHRMRIPPSYLLV